MPAAHLNASINPTLDRTGYMTPDIAGVNPLPARGGNCKKCWTLMINNTHKGMLLHVHNPRWGSMMKICTKQSYWYLWLQ